MLRWIGKTQLSTCRQTSVNETCIEIETVGRHDVTVNGEQFSTCRQTSGNKDCRLTRCYGNWGRHSFLPADRQAEIRTSYQQNVTVDRKDTVIHLQTDKCEQDMHRNRDCRPTRCYGEWGKQFSTSRQTSGNRDCRLTVCYAEWERQSFLAADGKNVTKTCM